MSAGRWLAVTGAVAVIAAWVAIPAAIYRVDTSIVPQFARSVLPGPLSPAHAFLQDRCEACHIPHRGPGPATCIACHSNNQALLARQPTAFHATIGDCRGCHLEHLGQDRRPTQMEHDALVIIAAKMAGGTTPTALEGLECTACHGTKDRHNGLFGSNCATCHGLTQWTIAEFKHPSPRSTDCAQCHQAPPSHYMGHFHMISRTVSGQMHARVEQCHLCHQTTAWNDIKGVGWYKHH